MNNEYTGKNGVSRWIQLPNEILPGKTLVEIFGMERVLIERHRGLLSYSHSNILVRSTDGSYCISGERMVIICMTAYQLVICGEIHAVTGLKEGSNGD